MKSNAPLARLFAMIVILSLTVALTACDSASVEPDSAAGDEEPSSEVEPGQIPGNDPSEGDSATTYEGLGLDSIAAYKAVFEMAFTPGDAESPVWTYRLDILADESGLQRTLSVEGVPASQDLGNVTLTQIDDVQYMTGEATEESGCLIFPMSIDLETSFLLPDDLLPAELVDDVLTPDADATVAGQPGQRYTFSADALGDFQDASGEIVAATDGGYVLRYTFAGATSETPFSTGSEGRVTWQFVVTDLAPEESISAPEGCEIEYPIMADAVDLARIPGMIIYTSPSSPEDVRAFYEESLPDDGWLRYDLPETAEGTTVLVYAREGWLLNVAITSADGGVEVQLFLED